MAVETYEQIPVGKSRGEHAMELQDRPRRVPAHRQPNFPVDHSRRDWIMYEREVLARCKRHSEEFRDHVRGLLVAAKRLPAIRNQIEEALRLEVRMASVTADDVRAFIEALKND